MWTTISYQRTAVHGLSADEAALIMKKVGAYGYGEYKVRERPDGLIDLFHIKKIRVSTKEEIYEGS